MSSSTGESGRSAVSASDPPSRLPAKAIAIAAPVDIETSRHHGRIEAGQRTSDSPIVASSAERRARSTSPGTTVADRPAVSAMDASSGPHRAAARSEAFCRIVAGSPAFPVMRASRVSSMPFGAVRSVVSGSAMAAYAALASPPPGFIISCSTASMVGRS